ncbi:APC membrane recruitment protein 1 [Hemicordylus capensis]|uniref:APC membrane recruitment protein 1 n=1 Tax=Hemicordylus capensis TaxID=884348 RepID=UPI00230494BC|nr:APC membrane recruitment protein 1 [Hemicordylus capensis]XP_053130178.1 APC membrane recruitment protein 1 [Hemicordylus capensis]
MAAVEAAGLEEKAEARPASVLCSRLGGSHQPLQENGAADRLSGQSDASFAVAEPGQPPAPASKLKKTAFKLFGGKRSICTLPSFFGGKSRGQGKGASRKGLSKSKTHDGISEVGCEGANAGRLRSPSGGGSEFPAPQLPSSQSALLATEASPRAGFAWQSASLSGSSEGFEKKPTGEKSLSLPKPKKGLKGLFSSIRRHRKNKAARPERTQLQEWASADAVVEERAEASRQVAADTQQSPKKGSLQGVAPPPECGENFHTEASSGTAAGLVESGEMDQLLARESGSRDAVVGAASSEGSRGADLHVDDALGAGSPYGSFPEALPPEYPENDPPSVPSGDQLSLMFGDVTSLQSFDSLTGCGDDIAEPDIDSITERSTSAERGREATKRSSCLVTYQGGGEEMAMPDEIEEYLQQVWEGAIKVEATYEPRLHKELVKSCELQGVDGGQLEARVYAEGTRNDTDLLTPHSDQQESAPNSDEGYYDSTTPGPEDEAGDGLEEVKKDRLPRDSYSGDALYEFYEPDDTLMSPSHGGKPWFDRKVSPPEIFGQFLDFALPDEKDLVRMIRQKSDGMETEEERLAAIQKQLLYWEMQREPVLKHLDLLSQEQHPSEKQPLECKTRAANLIVQSPGCLGCEPNAPCALKSGLNAGVPSEDRSWKDFPEMLCPDKHHRATCGPKAHSSCLTQLMENGSLLDSDLERAVLESCTLSGLALEKSVMYPFYRTPGYRSCPPSERSGRTEPGFGELCPESEREAEQAVNFSQALVEFTSCGTLFSSLSESLGSSDSESAFTQNLPALPTMVTFDIVDVEQEGEGECEQHVEMNTDEDIAASFEAFDDRYLRKESFAECDERMFPGYAPGSFQSSNWGVASLPRCLRLQEVSPSAPAPLPLCRRSRSLDTESLEFELAGGQLSKSGLKPCELWSKWSGCKKDPVGQENAPSPEEKEGRGVLSWPGLQNASFGEEFSVPDAKPWDCHPSSPAFRGMWGALEQPDGEPSLMPLSKETSGRHPNDGAANPVLQAAGPVARPSNLPLQNPIVSPEVSASRRHGGDHVATKLVWVHPLGDTNAAGSLSLGFPCSPEKLATCQPVGIMPGLPQLHSHHADAFEEEAERCGNSEAACWKMSSSASCPSATMNVTIAK